jgi:hypothetical protein
MSTYQVEVVEPSALQILKDLEKLKMIRLRSIDPKQEFIELVEKIRSKARGDLPTLDEITEEVEIVRSERFSPEK